MPFDERRGSKKLHLAGLIIGLIGVIGCSFVWIMSNFTYESSIFWYYGLEKFIDWIVVIAPLVFFVISLVIAQKWEPIGGIMLITGSLALGIVYVLRQNLWGIFYALPALLLLISGGIYSIIRRGDRLRVIGLLSGLIGAGAGIAVFESFYRSFQHIHFEPGSFFGMLLLPILRWAVLALAWKWPLIGGVLLILDSLFMATFLWHGLVVRLLSVCLPLLASGILFIFSWRERQKQSPNTSVGI